MSENGKVYVVQETNHSMIKAREFGDLVYMSNGERDDFVNITNSPTNERLLSHLAEFLREYDPEADFIVPVGSPYVQMAVFWILGAMNVRRVRILRWNNKDHGYIPLVLNLRREIIDGD